ncbi:class I SAM-dependent methyltransferase, partial [Roseomonas sp. DSM 102946]|nr:class I SAM-dependent methyltransferase [Roseomonas sp. DSM 102946]
MLHAMLSRMIRRGRLVLHEPGGRTTVFQGREPGPEAGMRINDMAAIRRIVLNPGLGVGESFMEGQIEPAGCSLFELMDVLAMNYIETPPGAEMVLERVRWLRRRFDQLNPAGRSRRNVAHHYDLDSRLYSLFLDRDRQYSCAYFPKGDETLEEAQLLKKRHIAAKLKLDQPDL